MKIALVNSTAPVSEPVICTFTSQHTTVTVRGPSLLKLAQGQFCSLVHRIATSTLSSGVPSLNQTQIPRTSLKSN